MYKFSAELSRLRISWFCSPGCPLKLNLALLHPALQRVLISGVADWANLLASWEPHSCFLTGLCLQVVTSPLLLRCTLTWLPLLRSGGSSVLHCVCFGALPPQRTSESWSWSQYEKGLIFIVQGLLPLPAPEWWPCLVWRGKWSPCV